MQSTGNDDVQKHDHVNLQPDIKKYYNRPKESSAKRRDRRVRADMRLFSCLVRTAQVTCVHHTQDMALAKVIYEYMHCSQSPAEPTATAFQQRPSPSETLAGTLREEAPAVAPAPAGCLAAVGGHPRVVAVVPAVLAQYSANSLYHVPPGRPNGS